jgi:hypothetical protein
VTEKTNKIHTSIFSHVLNRYTTVRFPFYMEHGHVRDSENAMLCSKVKQE